MADTFEIPNMAPFLESMLSYWGPMMDVGLQRARALPEREAMAFDQYIRNERMQRQALEEQIKDMQLNRRRYDEAESERKQTKAKSEAEARRARQRERAEKERARQALNVGMTPYNQPGYPTNFIGMSTPRASTSMAPDMRAALMARLYGS